MCELKLKRVIYNSRFCRTRFVCLRLSDALFGCSMLPSDFDALCGSATMMALLAYKNLKLGKITVPKKAADWLMPWPRLALFAEACLMRRARALLLRLAFTAAWIG